MKLCCYDIRSAWLSQPWPPEEIGEMFLQTVDALEKIDPMFRAWGTIPYNDPDMPISLDAQRSNFTAFVESNVYQDKGGDDPEEGYTIWAAPNAYPPQLADDRSTSFIVKAVGVLYNYYKFSAGSIYLPPDPAMVTYPLFKSVFQALMSIWPAPWANVRCYIDGERPSDVSGDRYFLNSRYEMPWMSYLSARRAMKVSVPEDLITERTPDGGLLMIAAESRLDPGNPEHMRLSKMLAEIMMKHGGDPHCL